MSPASSHRQSSCIFQLGVSLTMASLRRIRSPLERTSVLMLFALAWVWILGTVVMLSFLQNQPKLRSKSLVLSPSTTTSSLPQTHKGDATPLLIFTCRRAEYLARTLDYIFEFLPRDGSIGAPILISQDGSDASVAATVHNYTQQFARLHIPVEHWQHTPDHAGRPYEALALHYGWALRRVFDAGYPRVLILEEDLQIAPDFFSYFAALTPFIDHDPTILAVSAFDDNSKAKGGPASKRVLRSDFFPGLGWMMGAKVWSELRDKWPSGYWDDWLRDPGQRKGRHILRPEVSRTFHFGTKGGASHNQFGDNLQTNTINQEAIDWSKENLGYLAVERYDRDYWRLLQACRVAQSLPSALEHVKLGDTRLEYHSLNQFTSLATQLGLMSDEKAGVPRTAYKGVVEARIDGKHILFLTPPLAELQQSFADAI